MNRVNEEYKIADLRQTPETCPFNIYGRIVFKSKKGCAYNYSLLSYKSNKTLLWEKSRKSLEKDWEKVYLNITNGINQYEKIIKSVLSMKYHNYLKQFMMKLFRNNLYFKNITSKFSDSGIICNSCKEHPENRPHFFLCEKHSTIFEKLNACFINLKLLKSSPSITPHFYNSTLSINHPTNLILIFTMKFMYNLRFNKTVPNLPLVQYHISRFVSTSIEMYPDDNV